MVLARDGFCCQAEFSDGTRCGERASDVDHIHAGDDHRPENLQALCAWHHKRKSSTEGNAAKKARGYPTRKRPETPHPGLINNDHE